MVGRIVMIPDQHDRAASASTTSRYSPSSLFGTHGSAKTIASTASWSALIIGTFGRPCAAVAQKKLRTFARASIVARRPTARFSRASRTTPSYVCFANTDRTPLSITASASAKNNVEVSSSPYARRAISGNDRGRYAVSAPASTPITPADDSVLPLALNGPKRRLRRRGPRAIAYACARMATKTPVKKPSVTEYVLGTGSDESVRLGFQHRLWSAATHLLWERVRIQPGETVMDLGCGPGHAAMDLAQIVGPTGRVIAVDESATFLKQLHDQSVARKQSNIERVLGDIQDLLAVLPDYVGKVDVAYARWVLCFLPDPLGVVKGLSQLLKPGGRIAVQDYFNYERGLTLAPRREAFTRVINAVAASWRSRGGDTDIMGKLPGILLKNGFRVDEINVVQRVARPGDTMWHWPDAFWRTFVPKLVDGGFITPDDQAAFYEAWSEASRDPGTFIQLPAVYELIATKV